MQRFFIVPFQSKDGLVEVRGNLAHQIKTVLRSVAGDRFILLDNAGSEYDARLISIQREKVILEIKDKKQVRGESFFHINLYQSLLKKEKFELVLQKGTEIGAASFSPLIAHRCVSSYKHTGGTDKRERWFSIIREAAEQSERGLLPGLNEPVSFQDACNRIKGFSLIFWECEREINLYKALETYSPEQDGNINIFIGPEGGFTNEEIELARENGIKSVSLSSRILRSETAALVAIANIFYHLTAIPSERTF